MKCFKHSNPNIFINRRRYFNKINVETFLDGYEKSLIIIIDIRKQQNARRSKWMKCYLCCKYDDYYKKWNKCIDNTVDINSNLLCYESIYEILIVLIIFVVFVVILCRLFSICWNLCHQKGFSSFGIQWWTVWWIE